jgi:hypothetical protein
VSSSRSSLGSRLNPVRKAGPSLTNPFAERHD